MNWWHRSRHEGPSAVVVGAGLNGLGVVRSLGQAGVPVDLLATSASQPAARSRYARTHVYEPRSATSVVDALLNLAATDPTRRRPLILTQEETVATVSAYRRSLTSYYDLLMPSADIVERLLQKDGFQSAAEAGGYNVPRSCLLRDTADMARITTLKPPLIIKPTGRQAEYLAQFERAYRVENHDDAMALIERMLSVAHALIVQEWVDGDDSSIYFCLQFLPPDGQTPVSFVGRKLRAWPPQTGGTACCVAAPEAAAELIDRTTAFFRQESVSGFASMEYKRRADSTDYVMIEPTIGRTDHQEEIACLNGVNIALAGYCWATKRSLPRSRTVVPVRAWRDRDAEANAIAAKPNIQHPSPDARVVDALWRRRDPGPSLYDLSRRAEVKIKRLIGRTP